MQAVLLLRKYAKIKNVVFFFEKRLKIMLEWYLTFDGVYINIFNCINKLAIALGEKIWGHISYGSPPTYMSSIFCRHMTMVIKV